MMVSPEEVILYFGVRDIEIEDLASGANPADINKGIGVAKIYLGIDHAKRLSEALNQTLQQHQGKMEQIFSEVTRQIQEQIDTGSLIVSGGERSESSQPANTETGGKPASID